MPPRKRPAAAGQAGETPAKTARYGNKDGGLPLSRHTMTSDPQSSVAHQSTPPSSLGGSSQQLPRSSWAGDYEEDDGNATFAPSIEFYGSLDNKIVGVRYYNGLVNPGEAIQCRREPRNPYDRNAIRVDNIMGTQIGHIPKGLASKLAPYMDRDGIVLEGDLTGYKGQFDCPIRLYVYGPSDPSTRLALEQRLKADKLLKATELKNTRKEAEAQRAIRKGLKDARDPLGLNVSDPLEYQASSQDIPGDLEEVDPRAEVEALDIVAMDEKQLAALPAAEQPRTVESRLLPYQLQGLAWMTTKEAPQLPSPGSNDIVQLWQRDESNNFQNLCSRHTTASNPRLLSGGILADDMGLGKTLQVISLVMNSGFRDGPTLIIAPVGVMSSWEQQIQEHVKENHLPRIFRYHLVSKSGGFSEADFKQYDIVITSYGKMLNDFNVWKNRKQGVYAVKWRRVVLDEGHRIRNSKSKTAEAACGIRARSRWVLSGTPIVNSVDDFQSLLAFLRIHGGPENSQLFSSRIARPLRETAKILQKGQLQNTRSEAAGLFRCLIRDLCLRRKKDMGFVNLRLPQKTEYMLKVKFTDNERTMYNSLLSEARTKLKEFQDRKGYKGPQAPDQEIRFHMVLEKLLRLRQMCCHWSLCGSKTTAILNVFEDIKKVDMTAENRAILQNALIEACNDGEDCSVCLEPLSAHEPVITACKHRFGKPCILQWIRDRHTCPMCRQDLLAKDMIGLPEDPAARTPAAIQFHKKSSKTDQIERIVKKHLAKPGSKVVIFSQWTKFLDIIERALHDADFECKRLQGSMRPNQRDEAMYALNHDPDVRILLASFHACSVGVNLAGADTVVLADSWWAPSIEDQAVDRVHRLGQVREVTVYRMVMDDSIEYRVLDIQAEKRALVALAFQDEGEAKDRGAGATIRDVEHLLA